MTRSKGLHVLSLLKTSCDVDFSTSATQTFDEYTNANLIRSRHIPNEDILLFDCHTLYSVQTLSTLGRKRWRTRPLLTLDNSLLMNERLRPYERTLATLREKCL